MSNWYDDIDVATLQRIKTYSAFCDYKSQNLMLQTLYEAMQKKIDEYKKTNREIAKDFATLRKQVPQWHDLRKDPNDLPKEVGRYIVCYLDTTCERNTFELSFVDYFEDKHWIDEDNHNIEGYDEGVIAWCDIPTFDKE